MDNNDKNSKPIETFNTTLNLYLVIDTFLILFLCVFIYRCYNELTIIRELLEKNMLFK